MPGNWSVWWEVVDGGGMLVEVRLEREWGWEGE